MVATNSRYLRALLYGSSYTPRKTVYHANVTNRYKIGKYIRDFPVVIELQRGTQTAVMNACRKYLGRSYLYMVNYKICVHPEGTWIYHDGMLYLKNPADESIVTLGMLAKR
jgi:hypothetical protein